MKNHFTPIFEGKGEYMKRIIHGLDAFNNFMVKITKYIVSFCIAAQILIIFCGVIFRYFLNTPLTWVDEVAALLLVLIAFLGCYVALAGGNLARIELFIGRFKLKTKRVLYILSESISLLLLVITVVYGYQLFILPTSLNQKTSGLFIPLWIFYGLIPLMFSLCAISSVTKILHYVFDKEDALEC